MIRKNNIRSIRFSDEMAALIDQQIGNTFTQKFETLVTRCVWELPKKEEQLKKITEAIQTEQLKLIALKKRTAKLQQTIQIIETKAIGLDEALHTAIKDVTQ